MKIIPAIDLMNGQCVRLQQGRFEESTYYDQNPVTLAQKWESLGITHLHLVDLDGAKSGQPQHSGILAKITQKTKLKVDFGGGIRTLADAENALNAGASTLSIGSLAVKNEDLLDVLIQKFGAESLVIAADVDGQKVQTNGWQKASSLDLGDFLRKMLKKGCRQIMCTDVQKDGMMKGPAYDLYRHIRRQFPDVQLQASGGVRDESDLTALKELGCESAIVGKAIYEGKISLATIAHLNQKNKRLP